MSIRHVDGKVCERMNRVWFRYARNAQRWLWLAVGLGWLAGGLVIAQAALLARLVQEVFLAGTPPSRLLPWWMALIGLFALRGLLAAGSQGAAIRMAAEVKAGLRGMVLRKLVELGPVYLRGQRAGEWLHLVTDGMEHLDTYFARYLPQVALSALIPASVFAYAAAADRITALVLALTAPLLVLLMILIGKSAQKATDRQWRTLAWLSGHFLDVVRGLWTLKVFRRSRAQIGIIRQITDEYRKTTMGTLRIAFLSALVMELFTMISTALVAVSLGLRLVSGKMDFARAFALLLLTPEFYLPIRTVGAQFHAGRDGVSVLERILAVLEAKPPGLAAAGQGRRLPLSHRGYRIEFDHVTARYPGANRDALTDVCLTVEPGETVAIVGPSGAGKSTLLDVLLGYLRVRQGEVRINGVPLQELDLSWWREQVSYLPQHPQFFHGTVADNVRLAGGGESQAESEAAESEPADERVRRACAVALADRFIQDLPRGYDTYLAGEEVRLSGGQRQRLALARAVFKDGPVVLFDEPVADVDIETERALEQVLQGWLRGRTALVVAHRLGLAMQADRIVVMDGGRVAETGTHAELMARHGVYHRLFTTYLGEEMAAP
ncbi:hypothetical protein GCM10010885_21430 [Alicyclobacillus cellulosilyticus]|uniref:ATP-binding cassette subfamily C protein CydD n=1 Tax=Alicyclobacillus cellulosilyticus TaxID=1003997 RepID=A0A917NMR4_9BACL|nr:thiol reductant ABC exporter subunit CydD [Alicyclobacillus cellulosilyticus]GGJ11811.1 hypothetical protein GCM10010885_21430 [Alicyclobacillus cellulosilyticus]